MLLRQRVDKYASRTFFLVSLTNPHSSLKIELASLYSLVPKWRNWQTR
jgi:hypothetical protein